MKYTASFFYLGALVLAMACLPLLAQSPFVADAGTKFPVVSPGVVSRSMDSGDSADTVLTIKKRVDLGSRCIIKKNAQGKFGRNLIQGDFSILDHHKFLQ